MKQAWPASITGVEGFAAGGSVLEHKFGRGEPYTLGVEEEYMLLDGESFDLVQRIDTVLAAFVGHEDEARMKPELMQSTLEVATPVCRTAAEADRELRRLRSAVKQIAGENGLRMGSAGTHPFSLFERQRITARDRYRALVDQMQYVARGELTLLARRADRPCVHPPADLRGLPAFRATAALPRLRGLRRGGRTAGEDGLHRRLHAHLVGHPAASTARHRRDPDLRLRHPRGGRRRDRCVLPGAREALLRPGGAGGRNPRLPPDPDH